MDIYDLSNTAFYLAIALLVVITFMVIFLAARYYRKKTGEKTYTNVKGRVVIKGKVDYSGVKVTLGKLNSKEKVSVTPLLSKSGSVLRMITEKKGDFCFEEVQSGVHWIVVEAKGCKTLLKAVKLTRDPENILADIVIK